MGFGVLRLILNVVLQLQAPQQELILAVTGAGLASAEWSESYPQWVHNEGFSHTFAHEEEDDEGFFFEDTQNTQKWSDPRLDSVPVFVANSGRQDAAVENQMPYSTGGNQMHDGGCTSMLTKNRIRGFTRTEQTSVQVGADVLHSFSVVTISVSNSRDTRPDPHWYTLNDNFSDEFELTVLDEQATTIRRRSPIEGVSGCLFIALIAGGALLLVGVMLWATYAAAGAIVNFMFVQFDGDVQEGCLGNDRLSEAELQFKNESVTAPLLKP